MSKFSCYDSIGFKYFNTSHEVASWIFRGRKPISVECISDDGQVLQWRRYKADELNELMTHYGLQNKFYEPMWCKMYDESIDTSDNFMTDTVFSTIFI